MSARRRAFGAMALVALALPARGQTLPDTVSSLPWVMDGSRSAITAAHQAGDVLYIAGSFEWVAPRANLTGPAGVFSATTAELVAAEPALIDGHVDDVVADGEGGWFLAGLLLVDGAYRSTLQIDAAGRRTACALEPNRLGGIEALARHGQTLYVAGSFEAINGVPRTNLAAVDIPSCTVVAWAPGIDGTVRALHVEANSLFVGGTFSAAAGQPRTSLAEFAADTGALTAWAPVLTGGYVVVSAIAANTTTAFVVGLFDGAGGQARANAAAFRRDTGAVTSLAPQPTLGGFPASMDAVAATETQLYVGGAFDALAGMARRGVASMDLQTGQVTSWAPVDLRAGHRVVPDGAHVWVVGDSSVFKLDAAGAGSTTAWQPRPGGPVNAIAVEGSRVAVGGSFHTHHASPVPGFVAFDLRTGARLDVPSPPAGTVRAMAAVGTTLYVGGQFSQFGGLPRQSVAAFDTSTGIVTPFAPAVWGTVRSLAMSGQSLYLGGDFSAVNGQPRYSLAAVDRATGAVSAFAPPLLTRFGLSGPLAVVYDTLDVASGRVWAGGFRALFSFDAVTGAVLSSHRLGPPEVASRIVASGNAMYVAGWFDAFDTTPRRSLVRIDAGTGQVDGWQLPFTSGGGVAVRDGLVFASTITRDTSFAATEEVRVSDALTGAPLPWAAPIVRWPPNASVSSVQVFDVAGGLVVGGDSPSARTPASYLARRVAGAPLEPVVDLGVHLQGTLVTVGWTPRATGALPTSYRLVVGSGPGRADLVDLDLPATTTSISGVVPAGVYSLRLAPRIGGVDGPMSREITFVAGAAGCAAGPVEAPALQVTGAATPILTWSPPAGATVTGYQLRAGVTPGALDVVRLTFPATTTALSTAGVPPGIYYATVTGLNACGPGLASSEVQVTIPYPGAPAAPTALAATVHGTTVSLSWTPPAGTITGYVLEAGSAPGLANVIPGLTLGTSTGLVAPNVPPGTYVVRVRAANGALVSLPSNEVVVTVP